MWHHTKSIMRKYVSANMFGLHPPLTPHGNNKCPTCFRESGIDDSNVRGQMPAAPSGRGLGLIDDSKV